MSIAERRERQRAERYELILAAARELAEAEGWDAVTTRRLAGLIDYSQPVLYSHFKGKADIMAAVATRGFEELATRLRMETANVTGAPDVLRNVCAAYLDFARSRPVIACSGLRMFATEHLCENVYCLLVERLSFGVLAHSAVIARQVTETGRGIGVVPTQDFLANFQRPFEKRFSMMVVAFRIVKLPPILHAFRSVRVLTPQPPPPNPHPPFQKHFPFPLF